MVDDKVALIWVVGISLFFHFTAGVKLHQHAGRKLAADDDSGFISIDCGATAARTDEESGLFYHTDEGFIDTGTNQHIQSGLEASRPHLKTLRSFSEGTKNCYMLKPKQGKDNRYMIRATFMYGNYDGKNQTPTFDLYVGVSPWLNLTPKPLGEDWAEIIHVPSTNYISFCLVNINQGVPFISALELRHMPSEIYQVESYALSLRNRYDSGRPSGTLVRFKGDAYDRFWQPQEFPSGNTWNLLTTSSTIDVANSGNLYRPPPEMLQTAVRTQNASIGIDYNASVPSTDSLFYAYLHFAEIEELQAGEKREMAIYSNDATLQDPFTLEYLKPVTVGPIPLGNQLYFSIVATNLSDRPPILNGFEVFDALQLEGTPTNSDDIDAIMDIKMAFQITKNWQGDPCVDTPWSGLNCSLSGGYPRIISLNLTSSGLAASIAPSISNLTSLQFLDLSDNKLTGPLPGFLAELPLLEVLNLSGNDFTGPIPEALMGKNVSGTLLLRLDGNPRLCLSPPCKTKEANKSLPLILIVSAVSVVAVAILATLAIWWKRKTSGIINKDDDDTLKTKKHRFTFREILAMTDNLRTKIGTGGFGTVYLGTLKSGLQVAVKLLSSDSDQGLKEFVQEVKLLMRVHHSNVVPLIGYCKQPDHMALIYEYMPNGNIGQRLSSLSNVLSWKTRVQIAVHAAQGLEYLHNGCKPPIIHRDLKTANILLDENMRAKIADFGLSRACRSEDATHISTINAAGTPGYMDPACLGLAQVSKSSDVFSFGVILMELVTGKPAIARGTEINTHLLDWVLPQFERGDIRSIVDQRLHGNFNVDAAWKLLETAILCVQGSPTQRPEISDVLAELKQCLPTTDRLSGGSVLGNSSLRSHQGNSLELESGEMTMPSAR